MIASRLKYPVVALGAVLAALTVSTRPAFSNGYLLGSLGEPATVRVFCGYNTIGDALTKHPLRPLVIVVKGVCREDVLIERNRVTLMAAANGGNGIAGQADGGGAIKVAGAQNVIIDGLHVRSAGGSGSAGVMITDNGQATIKDVLIEDSGYGVFANHGGFFLLQNSEIKNGREYGLLLSDAANARIENSVVEVNNSDRGNSAAIGAFRTINIRLRGNNHIRNHGDDGVPGNGDDGFSLDFFHQTEIRQDGGHTVFTGPMEFGNLTHGSLRDPEIVGGIELYGGSHVDIRSSANPQVDEVTGGESILVHGGSMLELFPNVTVNVESIDVAEKSILKLGNNASTNVAGEIRVDNSTLSMNDNSSLTSGANLGMERATLEMGFGSSLLVAGNFDAFSYSQVGAYGPQASIHVNGNMTSTAFATINVGEQTRLIVDGQLVITDFSLMYASELARVEADMDFGGSATKVIFYGNGVTYEGNMAFSPKSDVTFGPGFMIFGSINCHGGSYFAQGDVILGPGSTIDECY